MTGLDPARVVWVTGAGSGMGRAAAVAVARHGGRVALSGRRTEALAETDRLVSEAGGSGLVLPLDARDADAVRSAADRIRSTWGGVDHLVLAAGRNAPRRYWRDQSLAEFEAIVATNLTAVARVLDAALPDLRTRAGRVVVVSSYSAWRFAPHAGVAYTASKVALGEICASLNAQEVEYGVTACHLCPGDVATDFLDLRPEVPDARARAAMLTPADVADAVLYVLTAPAHVRVDELVISPVVQAG